MSHKLLFESWRKYLTEQALNFPDEDEEEFDIYKLLNIDSITGEEFVDDVGKNSKEPVDNEFDINNAPFKKFNRTPRKKEDITALLIHESDGKGPIERLVQGPLVLRPYNKTEPGHQNDSLGMPHEQRFLC